MGNKRVKVNRLREGMIIDSDVYARNGTVLVAEGTTLTKEMIRLLTVHFIEEVLVKRETPNETPVVEEAEISEKQDWNIPVR